MFKKEIKQESLSTLENELIIHFCQILDEHLQNIATGQVKVLSEFNPTETLWDAVDITIAEKERDTQIKEFIEQKKKQPKEARES